MISIVYLLTSKWHDVDIGMLYVTGMVDLGIIIVAAKAFGAL